MSKTGRELKTTANKIKILYGVHVMISIFKYPRLKIYWSSKGLCFDPISEAITRDRFLKLRFSFHYVDVNNHSDTDTNRYWKVQPLIDRVPNAC